MFWILFWNASSHSYFRFALFLKFFRPERGEGEGERERERERVGGEGRERERERERERSRKHRHEDTERDTQFHTLRCDKQSVLTCAG